MRLSLGRFAVAGVLFLGAAGACATAPPPRPNAVTMQCKFPVMSPMPETKEMQTKGGIGVTVAVVPFQCVQAAHRTTTRVAPTLAESLLSRNKAGHVETTTTPYLRVAPERLKVTIRISNQLSRVFRGAGTVVQFAVAGKTVASKQEDFAEFTNVIIPPRGEQLVDIYGPPVSQLPEQATVGVFLYDVVTRTDAAGNITEKQNYEWYYNYSTQAKQETGEVQVVRE